MSWGCMKIRCCTCIGAKALETGCETFSQMFCGRGRSFCASDMPDGLSSDTMPMEFPTFGSADLRTPALHVRYADGSRSRV